MSRKLKIGFDVIGYWSVNKLEIVRDYAAAYSSVLAKQKKADLCHVYIDAFAGRGVHISKKTGEFVPGSPVNALGIQLPFREYYFVDRNREKISYLKEFVGDQPNVFFYEGDCNKLLLEEIFPKARYEDYRRALCLLDPYGLHLDWKVIEAAGRSGSIEIFLNFPVMDMNMNVLLHNPEKADSADIERMNDFWGDETWQDAAYTKKRSLFGWEEREDICKVAEAFRQRLKKEAGFEYTPEPLPMRNTKGGIVYYLFFASNNKTGDRIARDTFKKYGEKV